MRLAEHRFISSLLVPVMVLAHLFCACMPAGAAANTPAHHEQTANASHECCEDGDKGGSEHADDADTDHHAPANSHHHEQDACHCVGDSSATTVSDRVSIAKAELSAQPWAMLAPSINDLLAQASLTRSHIASLWLTDPSPPPNYLLRVKCSLQI